MVIRSVTFHCINTDLGSLIENFDRGYSTVWKFRHFHTTLILRETILADFRRSKTAVLKILKALDFNN